MADNAGPQWGSYRDHSGNIVYCQQYNGGSYGTTPCDYGYVNPETNSGPTAPQTESGQQGGQQYYYDSSGSPNGGSAKSS